MKIIFIVLLLLTACALYPTKNEMIGQEAVIAIELENAENAKPLIDEQQTLEPKKIQTGNTSPAELIAFSKILIGTSYLYASSDPKKGFDCSGFITHVFNHFDISVPRSSVGFTNVGQEVGLQQARPGDLVLFTGTDNSIRVVGHMGIITENNNGAINFIHSTSGRQYGVTITPLEKYYMGRFVKVIRVFEE